MNICEILDIHLKIKNGLELSHFTEIESKQIRNKINEIRSKCPELIDCIEPRYNTVDKFQGMEREIVIVSLVRIALNPSDFVENIKNKCSILKSKGIINYLRKLKRIFRL